MKTSAFNIKIESVFSIKYRKDIINKNISLESRSNTRLFYGLIKGFQNKKSTLNFLSSKFYICLSYRNHGI